MRQGLIFVRFLLEFDRIFFALFQSHRNLVEKFRRIKLSSLAFVDNVTERSFRLLTSVFLFEESSEESVLAGHLPNQYVVHVQVNGHLVMLLIKDCLPNLCLLNCECDKSTNALNEEN